MKNLILALLLSLFWAGLVTAQLYNNGCVITVQDDALLHVQGDYTSQGGTTNNDGLIEIGGNWINRVSNNPLGPGNGTISFVGDNQIIGGDFNTLFGTISLESAQRVQLGRTIGISNSIAIGSSVLDLNGNILHLVNPSQTALSATTGGILTRNSNDIVRWDIANSGPSTYNIPFLTPSLERIPLSLSITTPGMGLGYYLINTYGTSAANLPLPSEVNNITIDGDNSGLGVVDRFWSVETENYSTNPTSNISFNFESNASTLPNNIQGDNLEVIQWDQEAMMWQPQNSVSSNNTVTTQGVSEYGDFSISSGSINPDFLCPDNIVLTCDSGGGAIAQWEAPMYTGSCVTCDNGSFIPGFFYMGTHNGSMYYCSLSSATWPTAKNLASQHGGQLTQIETASENSFIASRLITGSAWIGLSDTATEGRFEWCDGAPVNYTNWDIGQPNDFYAQQDYGSILASGKWNDDFNSNKREFIMEIPCNSVMQISGPDTDSYLSAGTHPVTYQFQGCGELITCSFNIIVEGGLSITCPSDINIQASNPAGVSCTWDEPTAHTCCSDCNTNSGPISGFIYMGTYEGSHYYCSLKGDSWENAQQTCLSLGGSLAKISNSGENLFLANQLPASSAWIGASDAVVEGQFRWTDGSMLSYSNWYPGQPNDYGMQQDYVELRNNGEWNDLNGSLHLEYVMEFPSCIDITQISGPRSGSICPVGVHNVSYRIQDECGNSELCSFSITVSQPPPPTVSYCSSDQNSSSKVHIQSFGFNTVTNTSGNNGGYGDFTDVCTSISPGNYYQLHAMPGFGTSYSTPVYWTFWIDYNGDGDFHDSNEFIAYGSSNGRISGLIPVPNNIRNGMTRMRCIASCGYFVTDPCADYIQGEVEDYCINISGASVSDNDDITFRSSSNNESIELSSYVSDKRKISAFPNPVSEVLNVRLSDIANISNVSIISADGRVVSELSDLTSEEQKLEVGHINAGIYLLKVLYTDGEQLSEMIIIQ